MRSAVAEWVTAAIMLTFITIVLGTVLGIWIKVFWLGWVLR